MTYPKCGAHPGGTGARRGDGKKGQSAGREWKKCPERGAGMNFFAEERSAGAVTLYSKMSVRLFTFAT